MKRNEKKEENVHCIAERGINTIFLTNCGQKIPTRTVIWPYVTLDNNLTILLLLRVVRTAQTS